MNKMSHLQAAETAVILWGKAEYIRMVLATSGIIEAELGAVCETHPTSSRGRGISSALTHCVSLESTHPVIDEGLNLLFLRVFS